MTKKPIKIYTCSACGAHAAVREKRSTEYDTDHVRVMRFPYPSGWRKVRMYISEHGVYSVVDRCQHCSKELGEHESYY